MSVYVLPGDTDHSAPGKEPRGEGEGEALPQPLTALTPSWRMRTLSLGRSLLPSQNHWVGTSSWETSQEKVALSFSVTSTSSKGLRIWTLRPEGWRETLPHSETQSCPPPPPSPVC